jgi:hypothetical protein
VVEAEGHLIDSQLMNAMFDTVVRHDAAFDVLEFRIGRTNDEPSFVSMRVTAKAPARLTDVLEELVALGCRVARAEDAHSSPPIATAARPRFHTPQPAITPRCASSGPWVSVDRQRMDAAIVIDGWPRRVPQAARDPPGRPGRLRRPRHQDRPRVPGRDRLGFAFMTNEISSGAAGRDRGDADCRDDARREGSRAADRLRRRPVVVHTGGGSYFCDLIAMAMSTCLLAGNAARGCTTSSRRSMARRSASTWRAGGRSRAATATTCARSTRSTAPAACAQAVRTGVLTSGVMYECIRRERRLRPRRQHPRRRAAAGHGDEPGRGAGSLHRGAAGRQLVLVLSTMLHGIGVGNMLPAWVRLVCVDINPAVVTKLADRGSSQTIGIVTDVGLFLRQLASALHD